MGIIKAIAAQALLRV